MKSQESLQTLELIILTHDAVSIIIRVLVILKTITIIILISIQDAITVIILILCENNQLWKSGPEDVSLFYFTFIGQTVSIIVLIVISNAVTIIIIILCSQNY